MASRKELTNGKYIEDQMGNGIPEGGITGQVLSKASNADYDSEWVDNKNISIVQPSYKVYTALLTQNGGNNPLGQTSGDVTKGVTYFVYATTEGVSDFSNVGGKFQTPGLGNYYFVATITGTPNNYGGGAVDWNEAAPVVKVLENTIGNIWFTFGEDSRYNILSNGLFTENKTISNINSYNDYRSNAYYKPFSSSPVSFIKIWTNWNDSNTISLRNVTVDADNIIISELNSFLNNFLIEIRVYN